MGGIGHRHLAGWGAGGKFRPVVWAAGRGAYSAPDQGQGNDRRETRFGLPANQTLEQAEEYVKRGRSLAGEGTEELKQRWIKAFQQWVKSVEEERRQHHSDRRERDDIEAELLIRNVDLPYDAVKKEQDALIEATNLVVEKLQRDPTRLWKIEEELQEDLAAFQNKSKKTPSN